MKYECIIHQKILRYPQHQKQEQQDVYSRKFWAA